MIQKLLIVVISFFLSQVQAGEVEDAAAKAFAEQAAKAFVQQIVVQQLDKLAADILKQSTSRVLEQSLNQAGQRAGEQVAESAAETLGETAGESAGEKAGVGIISKGLAIYGIYQSAEGYLKAETQSQKYYASVQIAGAIASYVNPLIGAAISLAGFGQQMLGDFAMKNRSKALLKTYEEIMEMQKQMVEIIKERAASDTALLIGLNNAYSVLLTKATQYQVYISENCRDFVGSVDEKIFICAEASIQSFYAMKNAMNILESLLSFQTAYVGMENYLKAIESKKTIDDYKRDLAEMRRLLAVQETGLQQMIQDLATSLASAYVEATMQSRKTDRSLTCFNSLFAAVNRFSKIDLEIVKAGKDADKLGYLLTSRQSTVLETSLLQKSCVPEEFDQSSLWQQVDRMQSVLDQAKSKDFETYLQELFR